MATTAVTPNVGDQNDNAQNQNQDQQEIKGLTQAKLDEIVRKAMGRAGNDARTELANANARITQLEADLTAAKAVSHDSSKSADQRRDAKGEATDLQRQIEEMKTNRQTVQVEMDGLKRKVTDKDKEVTEARNELLHERKLSLISTKAAKENFVNFDVVKALTEKNFKWDETAKQFIVTHDDGTPRMNTAYDPMTPEEFFTDFASKNPYLVRSEAKPGTGSSESARSTMANAQGRFTVEQIFGSKSTPRLANELAMKNPKEYQRLKAEAKAKNIIA